MLAIFHLMATFTCKDIGEKTAEHLLLFCPMWAAECQQYFRDSIDISDVFQDSNNLVEFLISSGHLPLPFTPFPLPHIGST